MYIDKILNFIKNFIMKSSNRFIFNFIKRVVFLENVLDIRRKYCFGIKIICRSCIYKSRVMRVVEIVSF